MNSVFLYKQIIHYFFINSVLLVTMADSFGVSSKFLDHELSRFISSGRLHAKIDKVTCTIENCRLDKKNSQYQDIIKKGDILLNFVYKVAKNFQT